LNEAGLTNDCLGPLFSAISKRVPVRVVGLDRNDFSDDNFTGLREAFKLNLDLDEVSMGNCWIRDNGMA